MWGGLKSVAYLTIVHSTVKIIGIAILVGVAWKLSGGVKPMVAAMPAHYFTWSGSLSGGTIWRMDHRHGGRDFLDPVHHPGDFGNQER